MADAARPSQVVVITGGGGVLGRATAVELARRGWSSVVTGRTQGSLDATVAAVEAAGARAIAVAGDVSGEEHVELVFETAAHELGPVDAVLHAAATHGTPMRLVDVPLSEWEHVIATNMRSTFLVTRAALRSSSLQARGSCAGSRSQRRTPRRSPPSPGSPEPSPPRSRRTASGSTC